MDVLDRWSGSARALLETPARVWDAHTHTGSNDPDGVTGTAERLLAKLQAAEHAGAVVTTSQDPDGYPGANDRIAREAAESEGRLIPFLRVDPHQGRVAILEVERSLRLGHRGIKLHPRAERFVLRDPAVRPIIEIAAEARAPVLVHAGRGIESLGRDAADLCDGVDGLRIILAHAAISDLSWLGPTVRDHPGIYFDTAWWDSTDLLALFAWVPPGRIVYASDTPYGHPALAFVMTMRAAASARYDQRQLAALFGGTLHRLLAGRPGADLGRAPGSDILTVDPGLLRVHASLHGATVLAFAGRDPQEPLALARLGCDVPDDTPHADVYRAVAGIIDGIDTSGRRSAVVRPLLVAGSATLTPLVPVPEPGHSTPST